MGDMGKKYFGKSAYSKKYFLCREYPWNLFYDLDLSQEDLERYDFLSKEPNRYKKETIRKLDNLAMSGLMREERYEIFKYYYFSGDPVDMIARWMYCSEKHIMRELSKIRHLLKKNLMMIIPSVRQPESWEYEVKISYFEVPMKYDVGELELSVRTFCALKRAKLNTVGDIMDMGREALVSRGCLSDRSLHEIADVIEKKFGLEL